MLAAVSPANRIANRTARKDEKESHPRERLSSANAAPQMLCGHFGAIAVQARPPRSQWCRLVAQGVLARRRQTP